MNELSKRELQVLQLMASGLTNVEIGQKLDVALGTVRNHTHSIFTKLGVRNRTAAAMVYIREVAK